LILQKLQTHPDRNQPQNKKALNAATTTVYSDLRKLEKIAPRIKKRHEEFQERRKRQQDALKSLEGSGARNLPQELDGLSIQHRGSKRRSYDSRSVLDASENHSLATRLAQREVRRRDTARRIVRQAGVSEEEELQRRTGGRWESWQDDLAHDDGRGDLQSQLQEVARLQQNGSNGQQASYSAVSYAGTVTMQSLILAATLFSIYVLLPLPDCTSQVYGRESVTYCLSRFIWSTSTTTKGADIQTIRHSLNTTASTTQANSTTRHYIRTPTTTTGTRKTHRLLLFFPPASPQQSARQSPSDTLH
jgi:hypothetical protein